VAENPDRYHLTLFVDGKSAMQGWWPLESTARFTAISTSTRDSPFSAACRVTAAWNAAAVSTAACRAAAGLSAVARALWASTAACSSCMRSSKV
jgi:hypothetical protein